MDSEVQTEQSQVQLTRIEGVLNLVHYKVDDLVTTVGRHEVEISKLQLEQQQLALTAEARERSVVTTAKALAEAKRAEDAVARADVTRSEIMWTPFSRFIAVASVLTALATLWMYANK